MKKILLSLIFLISFFSVSNAQSSSGKKVMKQAEKFINKGDKRSAVNILRRFANREDELFAESRVLLGNLQIEILLLDSAILTLEEVAKNSNESIQNQSVTALESANMAKALYNSAVALGKKLVEERNYPEAEKKFMEGLKYDTGNYDVFLGLSKMAQFSQSSEQSLAYAKKASTKYVDNFSILGQIYLSIAETYLLNQNTSEARIYSDSALGLDSNLIDAYLVKAQAYFKEVNYSGAITESTKYISVQTQNKDAWFVRGESYFYLDRYSSAIVDYSMVIYLDPEYAIPYSNRGQCYYFTKQYALAEQDFKKLDSFFPGNFFAKNALGICAYEQGSYPESIRYFKEAAFLSDQIKYRFNLAMALYRDKKLKEALPYFRELAINNPTEPKYNVATTWVLYEMGDYANAEIFINRAIRDNGYIKEYFAIRAKIYRAMNEIQKAEKDERVAQVIEAEPLSFDVIWE